ncbi:MAG: hypothetical protein ACJAT8_002544 [Cellvibrionaceae bacterium]|jgi:hypothetical protein
MCIFAFLYFSFALSTQVKEREYDVRAQLHAIQQQVSAKRIKQDIGKLVSFGTRHPLSETTSETCEIGVARRWIKSEFDNISKTCGGRLKAYFQSQTIKGEKHIPDATKA